MRENYTVTYRGHLRNAIKISIIRPASTNEKVAASSNP